MTAERRDDGEGADRNERLRHAMSRRSAIAGGALAAAAAMGASVLRSPGASATTTGTCCGVNVMDYGATGNGTTDDAAAIQSAIDAASSAGNSVCFPAGKYLINSTLSASGPIRLAGVSQDLSTVLIDSSLTTGLSLGQSSTAPPCPAPTLELFELSFEYAGSGAAVELDESSIPVPFPDTKIESCRFVLNGGSGVGISSINQRGPFISSCAFFGQQAGEGAAGSGVGIRLNDSSNSTIVGNLFFELTYGVQGVQGSDTTFDAGATIIGNDLVYAVDGLHFQGWELVQAVGNILDWCENGVTLIDCFHCIIDSNYIATNGGQYGTANGAGGTCVNVSTTLSPPGPTYGISVRNNVLNRYNGAVAGDAAYTVTAVGNSSYPLPNLIVTDNLFDNYANVGCRIGASNNSIIADNIFVAYAGNEYTAIQDLDPDNNLVHDNVGRGSLSIGSPQHDNYFS